MKIAEIIDEAVYMVEGFHRHGVVAEGRVIVAGDDGRDGFSISGGVYPLGDKGMGRSEDGVGNPRTEGGVGQEEAPDFLAP